MTTKEIYNFIKKQRVVIMSYVDDTGCPYTKAMFYSSKNRKGTIFFFSTNTSSKSVSHLRKNPQSTLYFFHKGVISCTGVMLRGKMEVLEDEYYKKLFWEPLDKIYYPHGVNDPDYCILKFTAKEGRYYYNSKTENFFL